MRLGIISDTHGHVGYTQKAVEALRARGVDCVLHCGDIGSPEIVPLFADWPTHFVFGNVDRRTRELREAIERAGQTCHGRFGSFDLEGCKIALLHSDDGKRFRETVASDEWDLICYGHTHVADEFKRGHTRVLNPGAVYRATPHSVAVVELPALSVEFVEV